MVFKLWFRLNSRNTDLNIVPINEPTEVLVNCEISSRSREFCGREPDAHLLSIFSQDLSIKIYQGATAEVKEVRIFFLRGKHQNSRAWVNINSP